MGSSPCVVSWLPRERQGEEMEKEAVPEREVTVRGHLVTTQSPESACFRFLPCRRVHPQLTLHIPGTLRATWGGLRTATPRDTVAIVLPLRP